MELKANIESRLQTVLNQVSQKYRLTRRENQVVRLLVTGLSNKEIADSLSISPNSVKAVLRLVMLKMRTTSRSGLVAEILSIAVSDVPTEGQRKPREAALGTDIRIRGS